jgi:hypothetical protein
MYHVSDVNLSFGTLPNGRLYADVAFQVHFHPEVILSNLPFGLYMSIYSQPQDGFNGFSGFNGGFSGNFQGQRPQGLVWAGRESISANGFPTLQFNRRVMLNQFQGPWFNFNTFMQQFAHTFFTQIWLVPEHVEQQGWNQVSSFSRAFTPWMQQPWQMGLQEFAYNQFGFGNPGNWGYNQGFGNGFQREYFAPAQQNMFAHFGHPAGFGYGSFGNGFGYGYNGFGNGFGYGYGYGYGQQALNSYSGYGSYGSYPGYPSSYHTNYGYHQSSPISQQYGQRWGNGFGNSYGNNWNNGWNNGWNNSWNNGFGGQFPVQTGYQNAFAPTYYNGFQGVGNFNSGFNGGFNGGFGNSGGTQTHRTETVTYNTAQPSTHPGARPALAVSQVQY